VLSDAEVLALAEVAVSVKNRDELNESFGLFRIYPNPFSSVTTFDFDQKEQGYTTLKVYNAIGQEVANIISRNQVPGNYKITWNADNLPAGMYFSRISINGVSQTEKLYILK